MVNVHARESQLKKGGSAMGITDGSHLRLQQQIDCQLETKPRFALETWEGAGWEEAPGTDTDEAPLKYLSLILLDAIEERAARLTVDKDAGVTVYGDTTYTLPQAPAHLIARGLEILRQITGMEGGQAAGKLALGIRGDGLEVIIHKDAGLHTFNFPGVAAT
jgi:hypothetical protein